jgi:hypothetical protein
MIHRDFTLPQLEQHADFKFLFTARQQQAVIEMLQDGLLEGGVLLMLEHYGIISLWYTGREGTILIAELTKESSNT